MFFQIFFIIFIIIFYEEFVFRLQDNVMDQLPVLSHLHRQIVTSTFTNFFCLFFCYLKDLERQFRRVKGLSHEMDLAFGDMHCHVSSSPKQGKRPVFNFIGAPMIL